MKLGVFCILLSVNVACVLSGGSTTYSSFAWSQPVSESSIEWSLSSHDVTEEASAASPSSFWSQLGSESTVEWSSSILAVSSLTEKSSESSSVATTASPSQPMSESSPAVTENSRKSSESSSEASRASTSSSWSQPVSESSFALSSSGQAEKSSESSSEATTASQSPFWSQSMSDSSLALSLSSPAVSSLTEKSSEATTASPSSFSSQSVSESSLALTVSSEKYSESPTETTTAPSTSTEATFSLARPCYFARGYKNDDAPVKSSAIYAGINEDGIPVYVGLSSSTGPRPIRTGNIHVGSDAGFYYLDGNTERKYLNSSIYLIVAPRCACSWDNMDVATKSPKTILGINETHWIGIPAKAPPSVGAVDRTTGTLVYASHGVAAETKDVKLLVCKYVAG